MARVLSPANFEAMVGDVVTAQNPAYDEARKVWNGDIDRRPAAIARCTSTADVVAALRAGVASGLPIAVRAGGHSFPGHSICDGGLVIDLRRMNQVTVDSTTGRATVGGGAVWAELDAKAVPAGWVVTGGHVTHTGVAGLTLGGGVGHLMRRYGLTSDSLVSAEVVTADGQVLRASGNENPELFWAIRGGGGNFGVVTEFDFQLHRFNGTVFGGLVFYKPEDGPELMRLYRNFTAQTPDSITTILAYLHAPPFPFVPEAVHFKPGYAVVVAGTDQAEAEREIKELRAFGPPLFELLAPMPYAQLQQMFDPALPPGTKAYLKSHYVRSYSDPVLDGIAANTAKMPPGHSQMLVIQMGGSVGRVAEQATAFGGRSAAALAMFIGIWEEDDQKPACRGWARGFSDALEPYAVGTYLNLADEEPEERVKASYGPETYAKLANLKARYDPGNLFRLNQNIKPTQ